MRRDLRAVWLLVLAAAWVAAAEQPPCASCHPEEAAGYARTGMGQSLERPGADQPGGRFVHERSGSRFTITSDESGMRHRMERHGLKAEYPAAYFAGSGHEGRSYLVRIGDFLFQSPVSYYTRRGGWDMSPGFHGDRDPDFLRPVTSECLFCHSGRALPIAGTVNRYEDPPFAAKAITCERCHSQGEAHRSGPSAANIVNPTKLPPRARDSVCEQCHLGGEARVLNPGRDFWDFEPGMELEEVFSVYAHELPPPGVGRREIKVVSHAEQLALSACAQGSGQRMWCGSCHDPHAKPANPQAHYRERCLACHDSALPAEHPASADGCTVCHMPRRPAYDGAHTAFTDHQILRRPNVTGEPPLGGNLAAWKTPGGPLAQRNLGLAYLSAGQRDGSAERLNEGFRLLAEVLPRFQNDPAVLTGLGTVLLYKGAAAEAIRFFDAARQIEPGDARHLLNLAAARRETGETSQAILDAEKALELDPSLEDAYRLLTEIHSGAGRRGEHRRVLERFLEFAPQHIDARQALRRLER